MAQCPAKPGPPYQASLRGCHVETTTLVKTSSRTSFDSGDDLAANLTIPDDQLPLPAPGGFSASVQLVMAGGPPVAQITASRLTAVRASAPLTQVLYLQEAGDASLISVRDINQGQMGDCFLLSSIGEIALFHPSAIMNMITVNADGTESVTLYLAASGALPTFGTTSFSGRYPSPSAMTLPATPSTTAPRRTSSTARRRSGYRSWRRRSQR